MWGRPFLTFNSRKRRQNAEAVALGERPNSRLFGQPVEEADDGDKGHHDGKENQRKIESDSHIRAPFGKTGCASYGSLMESTRLYRRSKNLVNNPAACDVAFPRSSSATVESEDGASVAV